jgi:alpha-L-fucosidase
MTANRKQPRTARHAIAGKRLLAGLSALTILTAPVSGTEKDYLKAGPEVVENWEDMRFGMFLCWGPVSLTGKEIGWSRGPPAWGRREGMRGGKGPTSAAVYDGLYKKWRPDRFDAEQWVKVAKDAGQK